MFDATALVDLAKSRYGEAQLRERMRGAQGDVDDADLELLRIANGVIARVAEACQTVGWPLPRTWAAGSTDEDGEDISGKPYSDVWPRNLLQNALDLFNWRTVAGLEVASESQRRVGKMAEDFFQSVQSGAMGSGVAGRTDAGPPAPIAARDRTGASLVTGVPDRTNLLDAFSGWGWDRFS